MGPAALPTYLGALNDADASVRYWGVVGLHTICQDTETIGRAKEAIGKLLDDPSPIVRIAAAQALCDWGEDEAGLPVLVQELAGSSDTARLNAAIALGRIGDKARPALPQLKAAMKDKQQNVRKVTKYTLQRLEHN